MYMTLDCEKTKMHFPTLCVSALTIMIQLGICSTFHTESLPLPAWTVHQYPNPFWIENIAIRPNGNLLVTSLSSHQLFQIDLNEVDSSTLVYTFPHVSAVSGITELIEDVYIVAAGNFSNHRGIQGTWSFWKVDFTSKSGSPSIQKVLDAPHAVLPNGLTKLASDTAVVADSGMNSSWALNVSSLQYELAIKVPQMTPPAGSQLDEGINGLHIHQQHLYWTNSEADTLYRIQVDRKSGRAVRNAKVETVVNATTFIDDFAFDQHGRAWVATDAGNTLIVVPNTDNENSTYWTVDGSATSTLMEGSTSCAFGRGRDDRHILYVTTNGGLTAPINGTALEGGKIVAVDTRGFA